MKKIKFMLIALLALFGYNSAMAAIAVDDPISDNDYYYVVKTVNATKGEGTVYITKFNSPKTGAITLPSQITKVDEGVTYTFKVTGIADGEPATAAFKDQVELTSVKIPSSFEYIGKNAFYGCTALATIDLSEATGLKQVADQAFVTIQVTEYDFSACTKLQSFVGKPFVEDVADKQNTFVTTMKLPVSNSFKKIGAALAEMPALENLNIAETKIDEIVANAFKDDAKLTSMTLPGTVKTIAAAAFEGSSVATLTIDATSILTIGDLTDEHVAVYGEDAGEVLESLTITGELKGVIKQGAFAEEDEMTTLALNCTFGTTGQIETEAFAKIDKIAKVTLGDITDHAGNDFTIMPNAFSGELLAEVEIGNISTANAIAENAFNGAEADPTLTKVTIASVKADACAVAAGAFQFDQAKAATVTIGEVRSNSATTPVFGAAAFNLPAEWNATETNAATITIGAVSAAGKNFAAATFTGGTITSLTFNGDIERNALDAILLSDNSQLETLTFNGKVGEFGIGSEGAVAVFGGMPDGAEVNFNGALAGNAVAANAFALTATGDKYWQEEVEKEAISRDDLPEGVEPKAEASEETIDEWIEVGDDEYKLQVGWNDETGEPVYDFVLKDQIFMDQIMPEDAPEGAEFVENPDGDGFLLRVAKSTNSSLIVNYDLTNVALEDIDETVNPFDQKAFVAEQLDSDAERSVTLNIIENEDIFNLIAEGQISIDAPEVGQDPENDIIYAVKFLNEEDPDALALQVWQKDGTNTSYGRWYITAEKYPNGLKIARRGNEGVAKTLTLYTTYVEDDADHQTVNINMQPIVSIDGYYYLPASAYTFEDDPETDDVDESKQGLVILAKATGTNKPHNPSHVDAKTSDIDAINIEYEEYDGEEVSTFFTDNEVKVSDQVVTNEQLRDGTGAVKVDEGDDLYFITNPEKHNGVSAPYYDFRTATNIFINTGSFYLTATHYDNAAGARIIWHDGEEEATAIMAAKKVVTGNNVIYNLAGQKVNASYKGIVIMNGKKMIQK